MTTAAPRLIAWASGRAGYGAWHIAIGGTWRPLCRLVIPDKARRCDSRSYEAIRKADSLCKTCLQLFSESGAR